MAKFGSWTSPTSQTSYWVQVNSTWIISLILDCCKQFLLAGFSCRAKEKRRFSWTRIFSNYRTVTNDHAASFKTASSLMKNFMKKFRLHITDKVLFFDLLFDFLLFVIYYSLFVVYCLLFFFYLSSFISYSLFDKIFVLYCLFCWFCIVLI